MAINKFYIESIANDVRLKLIEKNLFRNNVTEESMCTKNALSISFDNVRSIITLFDGRLEKSLDSKKNYPYICKEDDSSFVIFYRDENDFMGFFHDLGHAFLHFSQLDDSNCEMHYNGTTLFDMEAQLFARAILMPRDEFEQVVIRHTVNGKCKVQDVADVYGISYLDVIARGKELNIWE